MSFTGDAGRPFVRVSMINLRTGAELQFPFMPSEFTESIVVNWANKQILGMSHEQLQYSNTGNYTIPGLEFYFSGFPQPGDPESDAVAIRMREARYFLMSLCYPSQASSISEGGPPRVLFVWPGMFALTCVLRQLQIRHSKFNRSGIAQISRAIVNIEEIRDARVLSEDVAQYGPFRDAEGALVIEDFL